MTVAEAARLLEISPTLVYKLCAVGRLCHSRVGLGRGTIRISPEDVESYKRSCVVEVGNVAGVGKKQARKRVLPPVKLKWL